MIFFYLLTGVVCVTYIVLIVSYLIGWIRTLAFVKSNTPSQTNVSIIIPARNEEENISKCIDSIISQRYPASLFEIIVVNDHSIDGTAAIVKSLNIPGLKLINLQESEIGKKSALAAGIKSANGSLIITTDADCGRNADWLATIVSFYEKKTPKMIVAPVLLKNETSFMQIIQSQEMTVLTACSAASLYYNSPLLCSGANLIYEKEAFLAVNGFENNEKISTGDDIFLMLKFKKKFPGEIKFLKSVEAAVTTNAEERSSSALNQRKRWASKTFSYGFSNITVIAVIIFLMNFLVLMSGIVSVINIKFVFALMTSFSCKCIVDFMLLHSASSFFKKRANPVAFFLASAIYPVYVSAIGLVAPFTKYSWKGRKL